MSIFSSVRSAYKNATLGLGIYREIHRQDRIAKNAKKKADDLRASMKLARKIYPTVKALNKNKKKK